MATNYTTTERIREILGDDYAKCDNPSLRLNKFGKLDKEDKETRAAELRAVVKCFGEKGRTQRHFAPQVSQMVDVFAELKAKLFVNLTGGLQENSGLCLHPFFGYPYLPGSAVKGGAHHAAWQEWQDEADADKKKAIAKRIAEVFGFPTGEKVLDGFIEAEYPEYKEQIVAGKVIFFAAVPDVPEHPAKLAMDIVTGHHSKYYQGTKDIATDDEDPIPLVILAVDKGCYFCFRLAPCPLPEASATDMEENLKSARTWLSKSMSEWGMGAKTAAGYGWFKDVTEKYLEYQETLRKKQEDQAKAQQDRENEARRAEERKKQKERMDTLSPEERAFEEMCDNYPDTEKLKGGLEYLVSKKCTWSDMEKKAFIRMVSEKFHDYWINTLKPLINAKPRREEQRLKQLAIELDNTDRKLHGKEGRLLK